MRAFACVLLGAENQLMEDLTGDIDLFHSKGNKRPTPSDTEFVYKAWERSLFSMVASGL